jgi:hypothetical protein
MCFPPSSCADSTARCSTFCPHTCPHMLGWLFPQTTTVGNVSLCSPSTLLKAHILEPFALNEEEADFRNYSKISPVDSPWLLDSLFWTIPHPLLSLPGSFSLLSSSQLGTGPIPYRGFGDLLFPPSTHSPRSQIGSAAVAAAPGLSVPSRSLPSDP